MYLGDFNFGSTVHFKFTTVNSTGSPAALSSGGVTVYRDGSTVQDTTGTTLTASFDTITGLNHVQVDMSTAGFYSSAGTYTAIISSGAASENLAGYVLAHWSLLDRSPLTSTAGLETVSTVGLETVSTAGLETLSTLGIETVSTVGLETLSTAGLETLSSAVVAGAVWNSARASFTAAGSFGQIVSTSTAAPDQWVSGPFSTHSTAGLETLSTAGIETLSTLGLETLSTLGIETVSTAGLETVSSAVIAPSVWSATRASYTAAGSFGQIVSTSTAAPNIWVDSGAVGGGSSDVNVVQWGGSTVEGMPLDSSAGLETLSSAVVSGAVWDSTRSSHTAAGSFGEMVSTSTAPPDQWVATSASGGGSSDVNVVQWGGSTVEGMPLDSTAGLETLSTAGIETISSAVVSSAVWNSARASFTVAGSFGQIVSTSTAAPDQWISGPFSTHSTAGLETLSTAGIETVSTAGLETISTAVVADAVWDEILTGATHNIATSAGRRLRQLEQSVILHQSTAFGGAATFNTVVLDASASTRENFYNHSRIVITEGTGSEQERLIVNYTGATKTAKIAPPWIVTPSTVDSVFEIEPALAHAETGWATVKVGIVQTAGASTTVKLDSDGSTIDDYYIGDRLKIDTDGSTGAEGQSRIIIDYDGSSKIVFVDTAFSNSPTTAAEYTIEDALVSPSTTSVIGTVGVLASLSTAAALEVNAEIVDALNTDTYGELTGVPAATVSLADKIGRVYMMARNQITVSSSVKVFYNDGLAPIWGKALAQDSTGSTGVYTEAEASSST